MIIRTCVSPIAKKTGKVKSAAKAGKKRVSATKKRSASAKKGCVKQTTKKYTTRPSPPYPANECCGMEDVRGQNKGKGYLYRSSPDANGVCKWKRQ